MMLTALKINKILKKKLNLRQLILLQSLIKASCSYVTPDFRQLFLHQVMLFHFFWSELIPPPLPLSLREGAQLHENQRFVRSPYFLRGGLGRG